MFIELFDLKFDLRPMRIGKIFVERSEFFK